MAVGDVSFLVDLGDGIQRVHSWGLVRNCVDESYAKQLCAVGEKLKP